MDDGELLASFEPGPTKYVLMFAFDELEPMLKTQSRVVAAMTGWTDEGERYDHVETVVFTEAQIGVRELFDGHVVARVIISTADAEQQAERNRRAMSAVEQRQRAPIGGTLLTSTWKPTPEHMDLLDKWAEQAVAVHPAGGGWRPRAKVYVIREGFNAFARDHGRSDLQLAGSIGGRAFADYVKFRFAADVGYQRSSSNPYFVGLSRKPGAKRDWFPTILGADEALRSRKEEGKE